MKKLYVCGNCGFVGQPKKITKGSFVIELVLWLCFLLPGLLYSLWRLTTRAEVCPSCKTPGMIPADSPVGKKLMAETGGEAAKPVKN
jgi:hypothetical protein